MQRPVYYFGVAPMDKDNKPASFPMMGRAVNVIAHHYANVKGLIHCCSYPNVKTLIDLLDCPERIITHDGTNREVVIQKFRASDEPLILVSPSMERGVDLPGDDCRWIAIVKVPYPDLGDKQISARLYSSRRSGQRWYNAQTSRRLCQMTGRGMRSVDDHCDSYILDANFARFYGQNKNMFAPWWREAVVMSNSEGGDGLNALTQMLAGESMVGTLALPLPAIRNLPLVYHSKNKY
jgi:Rad3-related DNA helicase